MSDHSHLSPIEKIKKESDNLRGTIEEGLRDEITGAISDDDQALIKFHGMYQQDDRDRRDERAAKKLERLYSFMIRLRLPGGFLTPQQWIAVHHIAGDHTTGIIKITTRQTLQLHGLIKSGKLTEDPIRQKVAAISCGIYQGTPVLDLDYPEDSAADADANFVLIGDGTIAEVQATAEGAPYDEEALLRLLRLARIGCTDIFVKPVTISAFAN